MATDLNGVPDDTYERWLREAGGISDPDSPTEENLVYSLSTTMRETSPETRG